MSASMDNCGQVIEYIQGTCVYFHMCLGLHEQADAIVISLLKSVSDI